MQKLKGDLYKAGETPMNYNDGDSEQLVPGAYICKINLVRDEPEKKYLYIEYDICEGEYTGFYQRLSDRANFWGGRVILSYKDSASSLFKRAIKAINKANPGYVFDPYGKNSDEKTLVGKIFAIVLHEEEYVKNSGEPGTRITGSASAIIDDEKARSGEFNKKLLEKTIARQRDVQTTFDTPDFMDDSTSNPFQ